MGEIVVTGAAGFVGSHLVEELLRRFPDDKIIAVDSYNDYYSESTKRRNQRSLHEVEGDHFRLVAADLLTTDLESVIPSTTRAIFHQAGQPGVRSSWGSEFSLHIDRNIAVTQRLLEFSKTLPLLERFVFASSSSVYGDAESYPTDESTMPRPRSPYGVTKLAAENLCSLYAANFRLPTVSLRYFTVYGPRQRPDMAFTRFCKAHLQGRPIAVYGDGTQVRDFTFVSDVVAANVLSLVNDVSPGTVLNISGGSSVSINQVLATLSEISGRNVDIDYTDFATGDVTRTGGSSERARTVLGWEPSVSLDEGLAIQYSWARDEMSLEETE